MGRMAGAAASRCGRGEERRSVGWLVDGVMGGGKYFSLKGICQLAYEPFYFSVADLLKLGSSGFDYVRVGHVVSRCLLSLVAIFCLAFVRAMLCTRAWVLHSCDIAPINCRAHCHYGKYNYYWNCHARTINCHCRYGVDCCLRHLYYIYDSHLRNCNGCPVL